MLAELSVKDFAIIGDLRLELDGGLNVLTGETGAGKSILVDSLGVALGDKVHGEQVRSGAEEATVEAVFNGCGALAPYFRERGIDADAEGTLLIRRRITRGGRHQAYVNGAAVTASVLADVGARLVDIHGQHQHQTLLRVANHMEILDDYGSLGGARGKFSALHAGMMRLRGEIEGAERDRRALEGRRDFLAYQMRELESAGLSPGEEEDLERERALMQNAEKISLLAGECLELLYEGEAAAAGQVESALARIGELARYLPGVSSLARELEGCDAVIREAAGSLKELAGEAEYDPQRHQQVEERLALLARLKKKYGAAAGELPARLESLRSELAALSDPDALAAERGRRMRELLAELSAAGEALSRGRERAARRLEKDAGANLAELGMPRARFAARLAPRLDPEGPVKVGEGRYQPWDGGLEDVEFLFSANPGEDLKPLVRVASGGELSRIMLAIKTSLARVDRVSTLIFDEIDAGIGGAVARVVGRKLKKLAGERQVICVTHLPQIASLADAHFMVSKRVEKGRMLVEARRLGDEERIGEIARMIAGETVTGTAMRHARQLMEE